MIYGDTAVRGRYEGKMAAAAAAPMAAKADRAGWYAHAKSGDSRDGADALGGFTMGTTSIESLDAAKLPSDLAKLSKDELKSELTTRAAKRTAAEHELREVAKKREDYLKSRGPADGFDVKVKSAVDDELK